MTESELPDDPRSTDDAQDEFAGAPTEPSHDDVVVEEEEGGPSGSDGAQRDAPAGEDYAGSGF